MPYSDPERRRQFHREYKRKWRKAQEKINPMRGFKVYVCPRFPNSRLAGFYFENGFLITDDPEVQAHVEQHHEFGRFIFALVMDLTCTPTEEEDQ